MGGCVSKDPKSAMKLRLSFGSKNDNLVIPSPVKDTPVTVNGNHPTIADVALKSRWSPARPVSTFRDFSSKEETFFDTQPWLESDCEDDFFSVNGDFTPSRGNTPVHHSFSSGTPQVNRALFAERTPGSVPQPSPTEKKKRLSELFKESLRGDKDDEDNAAGTLTEAMVKTDGKTSTLNIPPNSSNGTPYLSEANSVCGSERTPNGVFYSEEESMKAAQCCIPRLLSSRSFSERKKKMSPTRSVGNT